MYRIRENISAKRLILVWPVAITALRIMVEKDIKIIATETTLMVGIPASKNSAFWPNIPRNA